MLRRLILGEAGMPKSETDLCSLLPGRVDEALVDIFGDLQATEAAASTAPATEDHSPL